MVSEYINRQTPKPTEVQSSKFRTAVVNFLQACNASCLTVIDRVYKLKNIGLWRNAFHGNDVKYWTKAAIYKLDLQTDFMLSKDVFICSPYNHNSLKSCGRKLLISNVWYENGRILSFYIAKQSLISCLQSLDPKIKVGNSTFRNRKTKRKVGMSNNEVGKTMDFFGKSCCKVGKSKI